jgi:hypothetical protein
MRILLAASLLLLSTAGIAQKKGDPKKFAETITEADLKAHLYTIAGADYEGRETATEGQRKAATYIENHFKQLGLTPGNNGSYQQAFPVYRDSLVGTSLQVNGTNYALNTDFQPNLRQTHTDAGYFSEVVFVGHGIKDENWDDYAGVDVTGKAVIMLDGTPSNYKSNARGFMAPAGAMGKMNTASKKGAAVVFMVAQGFPRQPMPTQGNMYTTLFSNQQGPALYSISTKLADAITGGKWNDIVSKGKSDKVASQTFTSNVYHETVKKVSFLESTNVLGYIEGTDKKDEWLIISAHYDHLGKRGNVIYYGADDDGSGTVGILEIAEAFSKAKAAGNGPRRNVLIIAVSGEEKGLWGSEYYSEHPTVPMDKVTADLNIDMIGRIDTERTKPDTLNYVYVVGDDKISTELKPLSEGVNKKYVKMSLDYMFNDPKDPNQIYFRSDHYNFARKGVPVIFYYDGMLKADYHKPTDTPDKINYKLHMNRTKLVFYTAWEMANRDAMMKRDLPLPTETRN